MGEDEKPDEKPAPEHADRCHTAGGHSVPDECTDEDGRPLEAP